MPSEMIGSSLANDLTVTLLVSGVALLAVLVPFYRGLTIGLQALAATRRVESSEIERSLRQPSPEAGGSVTLQMLHVLKKSLQESQRELCPTEFVIDASRQYVNNDFDAHYQRPLSMTANILPPIGFIGTTGGLFVLFLSMRFASDSLELGALAMALTSSIFALVGFSILEALKFRLYRRMLACLDDALVFYRQASVPPGQAQSSGIFRSARAPEASPSQA